MSTFALSGNTRLYFATFESEKQHLTIRIFNELRSCDLVTKTSSSLTAPLQKVFLLSVSSLSKVLW